jgi:hypothetical protein
LYSDELRVNFDYCTTVCGRFAGQRSINLYFI